DTALRQEFLKQMHVNIENATVQQIATFAERNQQLRGALNKIILDVGEKDQAAKNNIKNSTDFTTAAEDAAQKLSDAASAIQTLANNASRVIGGNNDIGSVQSKKR
ncbi:MAG: hypothetical protein ACP5QP_08345, partial [Brevinematia bacterium]